jgi:hypothetical protein
VSEYTKTMSEYSIIKMGGDLEFGFKEWRRSDEIIS